MKKRELAQKTGICALLATLLILVPKLAFAAATVDDVADNEIRAMAEAGKKLKNIGQLNPSFYWVAVEKNDGEPRDQKLLDIDGNVLYMTSKKFLKELKMEGTGKMLNGKMMNYKDRVTLPDGTREIRWRWCGPEAPYGYGYQDYILKPFRSAAIDPTVVPLGSKLFIPAAKGIKLPDGAIHDGYFEAIDIGDAIRNRRIDIFTSIGDQSAVFQKNGMPHGKFIDVYLVE